MSSLTKAFSKRIPPDGRDPESVLAFSPALSSAARVTLDRELVEAAAWDGNAVPVAVGPKKIVCLKATLG